jgi:PAS domain S-box-containing protein
MAIADIVAGYERSRLEDNYHRRIRGEILPNCYEIDFVNKQGNIRVCEVSGAKTIWQNKEADMVILRDVTGPKLIEQALKISEEKLRTIFETITDGVTISDLTGRIIDLNKKALELSKDSRKEDILGKSVWSFVIPDMQDKARESFFKCLAKGVLENVEYILKRSDGSEYTAELSGSVLRDNLGKPAGVLVVSRDITERKQAQETVEGLYQKEKSQRQELEEEARSRGLFIDVLAHELRTPLTPILVSSEMLQELHSGQAEDMESKLVHRLNQGVQTLSARLEDLLDIGRYARGTFKLKTMLIDLSKYFQEVLARFRPVIEERGQTLLTELDNNLPLSEIDPLRLEQVIINLLSNASKFSSNQGKIIFKASIQDKGVLVEVTDFGIGITREEQERLFQPYHRIEQDRQKFPGIGLGLAVSKQIVEAHGGKIWLISQAGKGSTFSFSIPLKQEASNK